MHSEKAPPEPRVQGVSLCLITYTTPTFATPEACWKSRISIWKHQLSWMWVKPYAMDEACYFKTKRLKQECQSRKEERSEGRGKERGRQPIVGWVVVIEEFDSERNILLPWWWTRRNDTGYQSHSRKLLAGEETKYSSWLCKGCSDRAFSAQFRRKVALRRETLKGLTQDEKCIWKTSPQLN